jgi:aminopeptidase N
MTRVAKWKARQAAKGKAESGNEVQGSQTGMVSLDAERVSALQTLQAVIDAPKSLASDKIRAVEARQRILQRVEEEQAQQEYGELLALRQALDALPEGERVQALHALLVVSDTPPTHAPM